MYVLEPALSVGFPTVDALETLGSFVAHQHPQDHLGEMFLAQPAPGVVDQQPPYPAVRPVRVYINRVQLPAPSLSASRQGPEVVNPQIPSSPTATAVCGEPGRMSAKV